MVGDEETERRNRGVDLYLYPKFPNQQPRVTRLQPNTYKVTCVYICPVSVTPSFKACSPLPSHLPLQLKPTTTLMPPKPASTASKAPATASKAPATASKAPAKSTEGAKAVKKAAKSAAPAAEGEAKKKRRKLRKETYSSYIYKGNALRRFRTGFVC